MKKVDEETIRAIVEASPDTIMLLDKHGFVDCNPATLNMFACSTVDEFIGRHPSEYSPPTQPDGWSSLDAANEKISTAYRTGAHLFEWMHMRSNGEVFPAEVQLTLLTLKEGDLLQATVRDITERRQAEAELQLKKLVFERSITANSIADSTGLIRYANEAFVTMWGYRNRDDVIGKPISAFLNSDDEAQKVIHALNETGEWKGEYTALRQDESTFMALGLATTIKDTSGEVIGYQSSVLDVTERTQFQDSLLKSQESIKNSLIGTITAIGKVVEARDPYTAGHQQRVSRLSRTIAQKMGLDSHCIEGIRMGATIHDIGKINLPSELLTRPAQLNALEFELMKSHAEVGFDILKDIELPWPVADIAHQHHERMDGSGYPQGLKGDEICLEARIIAVADVVEAIASHRPYRPSLGVEAALNEISINRGVLYDSDVVEACLELFEEKIFDFDNVRINNM